MSKQPVLERSARKPPRHTRRTITRWIKRGLLAVGALGVIAAIVVAVLPDPLPVDTAIVTTGPLEVEIREDGQTRVRDRFVIAAPISGDLQRIEIEPGATVRPGAIVAHVLPPHPGLLDDRTRGEVTARLTAARLREQQARTSIERARFAWDQAKREAERERTLEKKGASTASQREQRDLAAQIAEQDVATAELQRAAAGAEIAVLERTLRPTTGLQQPLAVTAPSGGRVLRVLRESEGPVISGTPLLELGDPAALEAVVDVLSRDAERIRPGMPVELTTAEAQAVHGTVRLVEPSAFTKVSALGVDEQRVNVVVTIDHPPPGIGDAYRVDARIITWRGERVRRMPTSALFRDHGAWAIYTIEAGRARIRHVSIGHRGRLDVEVVSGVADGERVIVHPSDRVNDGVRVVRR
jgi:HlyD family secretion protein